MCHKTQTTNHLVANSIFYGDNYDTKYIFALYLLLDYYNKHADWGSIPDRVIPKAQKMVLEAALLNIQHYKVWIKGKVEQSREWSSALLYTSV